MNNWSVLVHHAATHQYRPGQEDTTLQALSSVQSDAGIEAVIHEAQHAPTGDQVRTARAPIWLLAFLRHRAAISTGRPG